MVRLGTFLLLHLVVRQTGLGVVRVTNRVQVEVLQLSLANLLVHKIPELISDDEESVIRFPHPAPALSCATPRPRAALRCSSSEPLCGVVHMCAFELQVRGGQQRRV